jgi:hypothetical protein
MKKLLLASVLALASFPGLAADPAQAANSKDKRCDKLQGEEYAMCVDAASGADGPLDEEQQPSPPSSRITVTPQVYGPPPIGWIYGPYTQCANPPQCSMGMVNVDASGLNVRVAPDANSPPVMALVNGTPLYPMDKKGDWLLVAAACDLTPTFAWSWTAGVPLNRCWVYF